KYMPQHLDHAPGHRVPSQRWRTFLHNHAQALIIDGIAMDLLTRGVQAVSAWIRRRRQHWWGRSFTRGGQESAAHDTVGSAVLIDTRWVPAAGSAGTVEVTREDDRTPPHVRPPRPRHPCPTARAMTPADTLAVRLAVGAGCWGNRVNGRVQSGMPLGMRASQ